MPSKIVTEERIIKKVTNAINNPKSSLYNLQDALEQIRYKGVRVYGDEYDLWISKAILLHRYDMILEIFKINQNYYKLETQVLRLFIFKKPRYLKQFVASKQFQPDWPYHFDMLVRTKDEDYHHLTKFFELPKTGKLLLACDFLFSRVHFKGLVHKNPDIQQRIAKMKVLLRFWFVVKRNLPAWRDSLYYPGTGRLYLKAYASFKRDLPCLLTCV